MSVLCVTHVSTKFGSIYVNCSFTGMETNVVTVVEQRQTEASRNKADLDYFYYSV